MGDGDVREVGPAIRRRCHHLHQPPHGARILAAVSGDRKMGRQHRVVPWLRCGGCADQRGRPQRRGGRVTPGTSRGRREKPLSRALSGSSEKMPDRFGRLGLILFGELGTTAAQHSFEVPLSCRTGQPVSRPRALCECPGWVASDLARCLGKVAGLPVRGGVNPPQSGINGERCHSLTSRNSPDVTRRTTARAPRRAGPYGEPPHRPPSAWSLRPWPSASSTVARCADCPGRDADVAHIIRGPVHAGQCVGLRPFAG